MATTNNNSVHNITTKSGKPYVSDVQGYSRMLNRHTIWSIISLAFAVISTALIIAYCALPINTLMFTCIAVFIAMICVDIGWMVTLILLIVFIKKVKNIVSKKTAWTNHFLALGIEIFSLIVWSIVIMVVMITAAATQNLAAMQIGSIGSLLCITICVIMANIITLVFCLKTQKKIK